MGTEAKAEAEGKVEEVVETGRVQVADSPAEVFPVEVFLVEVFLGEVVTSTLDGYFTIHSNNPVA